MDVDEEAARGGGGWKGRGGRGGENDYDEREDGGGSSLGGAQDSFLDTQQPTTHLDVRVAGEVRREGEAGDVLPGKFKNQKIFCEWLQRKRQPRIEPWARPRHPSWQRGW